MYICVGLMSPVVLTLLTLDNHNDHYDLALVLQNINDNRFGLKRLPSRIILQSKITYNKLLFSQCFDVMVSLLMMICKIVSASITIFFFLILFCLRLDWESNHKACGSRTTAQPIETQQSHNSSFILTVNNNTWVWLQNMNWQWDNTHHNCELANNQL